MSLELAWSKIKKLIAQNLSLIPVRDKEENIGVRTFAIKSPYSDWKQYQKSKMTEEFLFHQLDKYNTSAVAIICGKISENLEVIDIDEKYYPGISVLIFQDIKVLMPELLTRLRIHKTPSLGHHILYKILNISPEGNLKISQRETTIEERLKYHNDNPEIIKELKTVTFIETRGEAGYVLAPPSLDYEIINDVDIPVITIEERESLLNICRNYNKVFKQPKIYETPRDKINYYDENPYNHFSRSVEPIAFLESIGWKFVNQHGLYIWFTRPGKSSGVSGSFNVETRIFWSFSTSTDLEESKGYYLASLLIDYKFNGDKKQAHAWLVDNKYGKVNSKIEQRQIARKAIVGEEIPENFSEEAKVGYEQLMQDLKELHPYGIFWEVQEDEIIINREKLYNVSQELGYRYYEERLVQISKNFVHDKTLREYFDDIKSYIKIPDFNLKEDILNSYESFIERHGEFTAKRLKILCDEDLICDTKTVCYKFYLDKWIKITRDDYKIYGYESLDKVVLAKKVQQRNLVLGEGGKYIEFLNKACDLEQNDKYIKEIFGYYAHDYNDETMGFITILTEKCEDAKDGGRSGKNIWVSLLGGTTSIVDRGGSEINFNDNKIFQAWNGERIFSISDLPKDFDISYFKNISTGGFTQWKLHKDHKVIPIDKSFKLIFSTNFSFNCTDGGIAARVIALEFTDFFKKMNGVDTYFGCHFPKGWNQEDWAGYDNFVIKSVQAWFRANGKLKTKDLSSTGWMKQFEIKFKPVACGIIERYWEMWIQMGFVQTDKFNQLLNDFYQDNMTPPSYRVSSTMLNKAIEEYALHKNVIFQKDHTQNSMKGRYFQYIDPPF